MDFIKAALNLSNNLDDVVGKDTQPNHHVVKENLHEHDFELQATGFLIFISILFFLRAMISNRIQMLSGKHDVDLPSLNAATLIKEVFLAYLGAALLEPVLSIAGMEEWNLSTVILECLTFGSICWWIWLITDAFDYENVTQQFKYSSELREEALKDKNKYSWIHIKKSSAVRADERDDLNGNLKIDVALWFMLACIVSAWLPGAVTHADAVHAYAVVVLWGIMHHCCYNATHWGTGYFLSFFFPSASLMPLEYCLPLINTSDFVEDLDTIESYRNFVKERTGVEMILYS